MHHPPSFPGAGARGDLPVLVLLVVSLATLGWIASGLPAGGAPGEWDLRVHAVMAAAASPALARAAAVVTDLGGYAGTMACALAAATLLLVRRRRWSAGGLFASCLGAGVLLSPLKSLFERPRPLDGLIEATGYGFPSGHAMAAVVFWGFVAWLVRHGDQAGRARVPALAACAGMAVLIGASRLYLGVHWLSDVAAGYAAGAAWLSAWLLLVRRMERTGASHRAPVACRRSGARGRIPLPPGSGPSAQDAFLTSSP